MVTARLPQDEIDQAVEALRDGEVVAFPTETVYGLGADASNPDAVRKIFELKGRPATHPLIVHIDHPRALERWALNVPPAAAALAEKFWPGPLTLVLRRAPAVDLAITGGQ
ncbi:MAG: L-threonylcarbamoyladenylate synthase, partial [Steroidobacteraceae bacterium]